MQRTKPQRDVLATVRRVVRASGLTYQQIGQRMGYPPESARQSVNQLLWSTNPKILSLDNLAQALGVELRDLL